MLFGLGWPAPHRVIPNAATDGGATTTGTPASCRASINAGSGLLPKPPDRDDLGNANAGTGAAVVLPHRPDRRNAGAAVDRAALLCRTDRAADDLGHIGPAGGCRSGAGRTMKHESGTLVLRRRMRDVHPIPGFPAETRPHRRAADRAATGRGHRGAARHPGLEPDGAVRWLDSSGQVYGGAEAANAAVSAALGTGCRCWSTGSRASGPSQDVVYRWVADHRYRFPGTTPYCESHPVAC